MIKSIGETFYDEFLSDGETLEKIDSPLERAYKKNPEVTDQVLIALCGWSFETLQAMSEEEK